MARVLLVGSGGREHALGWGLTRSAAVDDVISAPGNPGLAELGDCVPVAANDPAAVVALADRVDPDLVVVGPEAPLVAGVADPLRASGRLVFGCSASAAKLEGSKAWMKEVLVAAGVPTARHATFHAGQESDAFAFLEALPGLYVIKTDGLASGKGVIVTESLADAREAVQSYLSGAAFGAAGSTCVIEEGMTGPELSVFALCDGTDALPFAAAQDHKRAFDGDQGPNTGGMGAYSPVPFAGADVVDEVMNKAIAPTLGELARRGAEYRGVLYCGIMLTPEGTKVVEYNVRFGDPECQVIVPRLASDLYAHCHEAAAGRIQTPVVMTDDACVGIALAPEGYPPAPLRTGEPIGGIGAAAAVEGALVFHAGTKLVDGKVVTDGGRTLTIVATAPTIRVARDRAYDAAAEISLPGLHYRRDIAAQALT